MAQKRMFSMLVIDTDYFLSMPLSSQALYMHLAMRADDDGFLGNARMVQRMIGASEDDFKLLVAKKFIIQFENGISVIRHWRINNTIRKDRYTSTIYKKEKEQLELDNNNLYIKLDMLATNGIPVGNQTATNGVQMVSSDIGLDLDIDIDNNIREQKDKKETENQQVKYLYEQFTEICKSLPKPKKLTEQRKRAIKSRIKDYDVDTILEVFEKTEKSDFLSGRVSDWKATLDWILKPSNFVKISEDNYKNKTREINVNSTSVKKTYSNVKKDGDDIPF